MHVLSNIGVKPSDNYLTETLIPWFTDFTLMFMVVSGFSLCCGYYDRVKTGEITPNAFYKKRYMRILPFFACLCLLDLVMSPSMDQVLSQLLIIQSSIYVSSKSIALLYEVLGSDVVASAYI